MEREGTTKLLKWIKQNCFSGLVLTSGPLCACARTKLRALDNVHVALVAYLPTWLLCGRVITSILITVISRLRGRALRIAGRRGKRIGVQPEREISLSFSLSRLLFDKRRMKGKNSPFSALEGRISRDGSRCAS